MTDYSEQGAIPVEDAAVADPPTVDEVLQRQRVEHPEQAPPLADVPSEPPAVASPGDSDAPDAPDPETVYPDDKGVPGEA